MAKYAQLSDVPDEGINVVESDLLEADNYIDNLLISKGVNPEEVQGSDTVKLLAVYYALYRACIREAVNEDSVFLEKAKYYEKLYKSKEEQLKEKLSAVKNVPFYSVRLERA